MISRFLLPIDQKSIPYDSYLNLSETFVVPLYQHAPTNMPQKCFSGYINYPVVRRERFGAVSIFPTNIPYEMGSRLELLGVSQPSNS